jgi:hypothetical protein
MLAIARYYPVNVTFKKRPYPCVGLGNFVLLADAEEGITFGEKI